MNAKKAAAASLKKAQELAFSIHDDLDYIKRFWISSVGKAMPDIRRNLAQLTQRIHEFNAYTNCIEK